MDPFSVSVGTLATLDECLRYGKVLLKMYKDYRSAETQVSEMLLKLTSIWYQTETQMAFLRRIWHTLDSNFQRNQHLLLSNLEKKLSEAVRLLNSIIGPESAPGSLRQVLVKKGTLRRGRYAVGVKDSLDKTLSELMEWHNLFDPSWYLLARLPDDELDRNLASNPKDEALKKLAELRKSVRDLNSDTGTSPRAISSDDFLGPRLPIAASCSATAQIEALSRMEPFTFGLLRCCGVINKMDRYDFVFEIPRGLRAPRSMRELLAHQPPSLNVKLDIAKQLANSVLYLHATGFVHKNIRPETILVFDHDHGEVKSSFLVGFENFRTTKDDTFKIGDSLPERELYRHPLRQGNNPEHEYMMQHDIYSLGVCLLGIGLWRSFISADEGRYVVTEFDPHLSTQDGRKRAFRIKEQILIMADEQLPQHTGEIFKDIVETCVTCLDDDTTWGQVDDRGTTEIDVGVEFIENVLLRLQEIVV